MHATADDSFGACAPDRFDAFLLRAAHALPANRLGKHVAHGLRALVLARGRLPIDVRVEGIRLRCYLRDNYSEKKFVFTPWRYDPQERGYLARVLPADGTFVDVGANIGLYSLSAALLLGDRGTVVAVEPNPRLLERLRFNLAATAQERSTWPTVRLVQAGISDREEELDLHLEAGNLGASSVVADSGATTRQQIRVPCRPLAAVLEDLGIASIDVLKIDIEGAEDKALIPFLARCRATATGLPRHIIIERSEALWQQDLLGALSEAGYAEVLRTRLNAVYALD